MLKLLRTPIADAPRRARRDVERRAVEELLRRELGPGATLAHDPDGRPRVTGVAAPPFVSISHCRDEAVVALSDEPVGVDIETLRPALAATRHKWLSEAELAPMGSGHPDAAMLLRLWTAKEAVFKALAVQPASLLDVTLPHPHFAVSHIMSCGGTKAVAIATPKHHLNHV